MWNLGYHYKIFDIDSDWKKEELENFTQGSDLIWLSFERIILAAEKRSSQGDWLTSHYYSGKARVCSEQSGDSGDSGYILNTEQVRYSHIRCAV